MIIQIDIDPTPNVDYVNNLIETFVKNLDLITTVRNYNHIFYKEEEMKK